MKNLTVNRLALGNLKHRRKQYTIMIIGIILAMVFSSSFVLFLFSASDTSRQKRADETGWQSNIVYSDKLTEQDYRKAVDGKVLKQVAFAHTIGFGYMQEENEYLGASIAKMDEECRKLSNMQFIEGHYPTKKNEAAIEKNTLIRFGYDNAKIGDKISFKVKIQNGEDYLKTVDKTYTLCGILTDKKKNTEEQFVDKTTPDTMVPAIYVSEDSAVDAGGKEKLLCYMDLSYDDFYRFLKENKLENGDSLVEYLNIRLGTNMEYVDITEHATGDKNDFRLASMDTFTANGDFILIIVFVLILASCVSIINTFNINLKERKRQIGMLRAVGATRRQIIKIFGREALIISLIATPISIAISYGIVKAVLSIITDNAIISKSLLVLPIAALIDIIVVMMSAFIPLIIASKVTPMQAVRNISNNRKIKTKRIKTKKQFNASAHLAKRNLIFYKGSRVAVAVILSVTVLFTCFGFSFLSYSQKNIHTMPYDYMLGHAVESFGNSYNTRTFMKGVTQTDYNNIASMPYVGEINGDKSFNTLLEIDEISDYFKAIEPYWFEIHGETVEETAKSFKNTDSVDEYTAGLMKATNITSKGVMDFPAVSIDPSMLEEIKKLKYEGEINAERISSGEEIILVAPQKVEFAMDISGIRQNSFYERPYYDEQIKSIPSKMTVIGGGESIFKVGDKLTLDIIVNEDEKEEGEEHMYEFDEVTKKEVTVGAIISPAELEKDTKVFYINGIGMITTNQGAEHFIKGLTYNNIYFNANAELDDKTDLEITETLQQYGDKYQAWTESNYALRQQEESTNRAMLTGMLAIIIIAFVICASIINNTMTARIRENKAVIGTLRAVGADRSDLVKSFARQMVSMLLWGGGIGYAVFTVLYFAIKAYCNANEGNFEFYFRPWYSLIFIALLFAVCTVNLYVKIRKEMKNSIVENIREL